VGVLYRSPSGNVSSFLQYLEDIWLEGVADSEVDCYIAGDFNIDWQKVRSRRTLKDVMDSFGMSQIVTDFTRIAHRNGVTSQSTIDLVFTNTKEATTEIDASRKVSDHETIFVSVPENEDEKLKKTIKCWKNYTPEKLNNLITLALRDWKSNNSVNAKMFHLIDILKTSVNSLVYEKVVKVTGKTKKWFNEELNDLQSKRNNALEKANRTKSPIDLFDYRRIRNQYVNELRKAEKEFLKAEVNSNSKDGKKMWKCLNNYIRKKPELPSSITFKGRKIENPSDIAENFNSYFVESVESINRELPEIRDEFDHGCQPVFINFEKISLCELEEVILNLKESGSPDEITVKVIKDSLTSVKHVLLEILNQSLEEGVFPEVLKETLVVPIQKVAKTSKAEEFRPVNMLMILEKILESLVKKRVQKFVNLSSILIEEQSGFRENHSCETALVFLLNKWKKLIEEKQTIFSVFLDLKRAFETISRCKLIKVLENYGFGGVVLEWFRDYLTDRTQRTRFNSAISSSRENKLGVPQGSVLGPLLFILYVNDVKDILSRCNVNLFADDTVIYVAHKNPDIACDILNDDLENIYYWMNSKKLKINCDKTKVLIISNKKDIVRNNFDVIMNGEHLEVVDNVKYLGVKIDDQLRFDEHISYTIQKIAVNVGLMSRMSSIMNFETKVLVYKSLIAPHFDYCGTIMFLANKLQQKRLQRQQNKALRLILKCDWMTPTNLMLEAVNFLSVKQRIVFNVLTFIHKMKLQLLPNYLSSKLTTGRHVHRYGTRNANELRTENFRMASTQNDMFYNGIRRYNMLPSIVKAQENIKMFKRSIVPYLKENY
jgi:hypothetical protein